MFSLCNVRDCKRRMYCTLFFERLGGQPYFRGSVTLSTWSAVTFPNC